VFSYVFMRLLEGRPRSYDRRMDRVSGGRVRALKEAVAAAVPTGARVLEMGCGTGELLVLLAGRGATVVGFDVSPAMLAVARERIEAADLSGRVAVREHGVEGLDGLDPGAWDAVVSTLVLSELTDDERRFALREAHRVLAPGGRLLVVAEVVPGSRLRRAVQTAVRAPLLALTWLSSRGVTRPVADLTGEVRGAGFVIDRNERSHGDAVAFLVAHRPEANPQ